MSNELNVLENHDDLSNLSVQDASQPAGKAILPRTEAPLPTTDWEAMQSSKEEMLQLIEAAKAHHAREGVSPVPEAPAPVTETSNAPRKPAASSKKAKKAHKSVDVSPLLDKYQKSNRKASMNTPKSTSRAALLVPANRQAVSYLTEAFANKTTDATSGEDGVDHLNVSAMGHTKLGKFLDINAKAPFQHPELSHFNSVGGLWFYVKTEDHNEDFRYVWGDRCRKMGKMSKTLEVKGFKTIIADATWIKVISNPEMVQEMIDSTLPFKSYFYFGALHIKKIAPEAPWYCKVLEEIRRVLKLRVEAEEGTVLPDFSFLERQDPPR